METDVHAIPQIIDLCTPNFDSMEQLVETPIMTVNKSIASTITFERISELDQRLSILPLYPTSIMQDHQGKYPLLANLSRMYSCRNLS